MAIRDVKMADGSVVYWVMVRWRGRQEWERSGRDRREAERLEVRRKAEVKAGTYIPPKRRRVVAFGPHLSGWLGTRKNRAADNDRDMVERHVLGREDHAAFCAMALNQIQPPDILAFVQKLKAAPRKANDPLSKPLAPKSVALICGVIRTMFRDAHFNGIIPADPWVLPRKTISRRVVSKRTIYPLDELQRLFAANLLPDERMFLALLVFTGCRMGEICGRRWRSWDPTAEPLGSLLVDTQYDDQPIKGDDDFEERPRLVPVHPALEAELAYWWEQGFELTHCRKPTKDDFIVPQRSGAHRTKSAGYKLWRRLCERAGVDNRSVHSTRHTFTTMCLRFGAHKPTLERVTHNAKGDMVDQYNHPEWEPLCEQVIRFPDVTEKLSDERNELNSGSSAWTRTRETADDSGHIAASIGASERRAGGAKKRVEAPAASASDAPQQQVLSGPVAERALDACLTVAADAVAASLAPRTLDHPITVSAVIRRRKEARDAG